MSCKCGVGVPEPNDEEVIKYAPLNEAFKGSYGNFTKFEKLLIITIIIICFFLYKESKV